MSNGNEVERALALFDAMVGGVHGGNEHDRPKSPFVKQAVEAQLGFGACPSSPVLAWAVGQYSNLSGRAQDRDRAIAFLRHVAAAAGTLLVAAGGSKAAGDTHAAASDVRQLIAALNAVGNALVLDADDTPSPGELRSARTALVRAMAHLDGLRASLGV